MLLTYFLFHLDYFLKFRHSQPNSLSKLLQSHAVTHQLQFRKWRLSEDFTGFLFNDKGGGKKLPFRGTRPSVIMPEVSKMKKPDVKVVLLGDMNVGKTSLLHRYTERKFKDTVSTVGGAFYLKQWGPYNISIWDTAGNISFMSSL